MRILIPQGIGDAYWALQKARGVAIQAGGAQEPVEIAIACFDPESPAEARSLDFARRIPWVQDAQLYCVPRRGQSGASLLPGPPADSQGYYRYLPDGPPPADFPLPGVDFVLSPNAPLERGQRLESWLPQIPVDWSLARGLRVVPAELDIVEDGAASHLRGPYAVFFLGSLAGNTLAGHNRNSLWRPEDWINLGRLVRDRLGLRIVVLGAEYDLDYLGELAPWSPDWECLIGQTTIGEAAALLRFARFGVFYQSGLAVLASGLGTPTAVFWRAKGDSVCPHNYISFEEGMASAWADPEMIDSGKHLPLIYGRCDGECVFEEIQKRGW